MSSTADILAVFRLIERLEKASRAEDVAKMQRRLDELIAAETPAEQPAAPAEQPAAPSAMSVAPAEQPAAPSAMSVAPLPSNCGAHCTSCSLETPVEPTGISTEKPIPEVRRRAENPSKYTTYVINAYFL